MPSSGLMSRPHLPPNPARWAVKLAGGRTRPARTVRLGVPAILKKSREVKRRTDKRGEEEKKGVSVRGGRVEGLKIGAGRPI